MRTYTPLRIALDVLAIAALALTFNSCVSERTGLLMKYDSGYDILSQDSGAEGTVDLTNLESHTKPSDVDGSVDFNEFDVADISLDELIDISDSTGLDVINKDLPGIDDIPNDTGVVYNDIVSSDGSVLGNPDAPVTIAMFGGYKCPYSKKFYDNTFSQLKEDYIDTGIVNFSFKNMPLDFHEYSYESAEAAECAKDQGMFWKYHNLLFANQGILNDETFELLAGELGMDVDQFNQCYSSDKYSAQIEADFDKAVEAGVIGTPSFFINGKLFQGNIHYSMFEEAIQKELDL